MAQGLPNDSWVRDIKGALTVQVILDFFLVWDATRNLVLQNEVQDMFLWKWTNDHRFSTASAYRAFFIGQTEIPGAKILKKARAPGKCKFFIWLALHDRCWTAERRKRHNLQDNDSCILYAQESESIAHLLVGCSFTREVWYHILLRLRWHALTPDRQCFDLADWWTSVRKRLQKTDRRCFDSLVILTSWFIWNERNRRTFDNGVKTVVQLISAVQEEALNWVLAGFKQLEVFTAAIGSVTGRQIVPFVI